MNRRLVTSIIFLLVVGFSSLSAQDWAASLKVSTLGGSAEVYRSFGESFNIHFGYNYFKMNSSLGETEDYTSEAEAGLNSISALADFFPFDASNFRITGGLIYNLNVVNATLTPIKSYTVGNDVYTPEELGTLDAKIEFNKFAPYIGFGFGNPTSGEAGLGFMFDIGTMYHGAAIVDLTAEGLLEPSAAQDQEELIEDNLSWFKWYPVVSFGLTYKF